MALFAKINVNGVDYFNALRIRVRNAANEATSTFEADFDNTGGSKESTFTVGQEVIVHVSTTSSFSDATRRFTGILERIEFDQQGTFRSIVSISGRDYGSRLMDAQARDTYNNTEVSVIIKNLLDLYATSIGQSKIQTTSKTVTHVTFRHKTLWECIEYLANMVGYVFYVDVAKDLVFAPDGGTTEATAIDQTNAVDFDWDDNSREIFNYIWVYGDRYLSGYSQTFTADGAGSVYTLSYNPHDTAVTINGTIRRGGIFEIASTNPSGANYLVDYDQKKIICLSGTNNGDFVNISGQSIVVDYQRALPIVKLASDSASQALYGRKEKVILDKEIKDPQQATDLAKAQLALLKDLKTSGRVKLRGNFLMTAGNWVQVTAPHQNITSEIFRLMEVNYDLTQERLLREEVMEVRVAERRKELEDQLKNIIKDINKLKNADIDSSDIFSRLESFTGSFGIKVREWYAYTRTLGSSFVIGHTTYGDLGSGTDQANPQTYLGDSRGALTAIASGGTFA